MNKLHLLYRRLMPDVIIEGWQLFHVRFSAEKYHWSSVFSCGISPANSQMLDLAPRRSNLFDSQSTWRIISQSTGHIPLWFFNFFSLLISLGFGFLWLQLFLFYYTCFCHLSTYSYAILDCGAWMGLAEGSSHACRLLPLKTKQVDFFFNKKKIFFAEMK